MKGEEKMLEVTQEAAFFVCNAPNYPGEGSSVQQTRSCKRRLTPKNAKPLSHAKKKEKEKEKEGDTSVATCTAIEDDSNSPISNRGPSVTSLVALTSEPGWSPVPIWTWVLGH